MAGQGYLTVAGGSNGRRSYPYICIYLSLVASLFSRAIIWLFVLSRVLERELMTRPVITILSLSVCSFKTVNVFLIRCEGGGRVEFWDGNGGGEET